LALAETQSVAYSGARPSSTSNKQSRAFVDAVDDRDGDPTAAAVVPPRGVEAEATATHWTTGPGRALRSNEEANAPTPAAWWLWFAAVAPDAVEPLAAVAVEVDAGTGR
jgi:hypothetical protein